MRNFSLVFAVLFFITLNSWGQTSDIHPSKYVVELKKYEPQVFRDINLEVYYDYDEAIKASKKTNKPILLYFNAIFCMPCRKMETDVWKNEKIAKSLREDFIVVSLLCDMDKIILLKKQQYYSKYLKKQVLTLGDKYLDLEHTFGCDGQPAYFFIDEKGISLAKDGYLYYNPDTEQFIRYLDKIKKSYRKRHS